MDVGNDEIFKNKNADLLGQIEAFEKRLEIAEKKGLSAYAPEEGAVLEADMQLIRNRTIATRLWMLGYLAKGKPDDNDTDKDINDQKYKEAVQQFEKDSFLKQTNDPLDTSKMSRPVRNETWFALDRLVSFEPMLDPDVDKPGTRRFIEETWYKNRKPNLPLQRAIQLRLFALGLFDKNPSIEFLALPEDNWMETFEKKGIGAFKNIVHMFKLYDKEVKGEVIDVPSLVEILFDQDNIVKKLSVEKSEVRTEKIESFSIKPIRQMPEKDKKNLVKKFVINVAKIELWLHGFDGVEIDGQESYIMPPRTERSRMPLANRKAQYPFYNALCEYWDIWKDRRALDHECMKKIATSKDVEKYKSLDDALSRADYSTLTENITPVFFASLHCVYEDDSDSDFDYCGELAKKIENKEISVDVQWEIIKKKGSRLWDGIKRVWKWIKKQFKKIFVFFKNIFARTIFRYAAKAFKIVKRAVSAIVETVEYLVHNKMDGSDLENIFVLHDSDFDQKVFISQNADPEKVNEFVRRWNVIIARFNLGSKIIGIVFFCIKNVNTIVGWARIVYSFIKDMKTLKPIYEQLKVVEAVA